MCGEKAGLFVESDGRAVVPDDVIGAGDFRREVELRPYHPLNQRGRKASICRQPRPLGGRCAGDYHHTIAFDLPSRLEEQRDIEVKPLARPTSGAGQRQPTRPHYRVNQLFQGAARGLIVEDDLP